MTEDLTGIEVAFELFPSDRFWTAVGDDFTSPTSRYDGVMVGLWPGGRYHYGNDVFERVSDDQRTPQVSVRSGRRYGRKRSVLSNSVPQSSQT